MSERSDIVKEIDALLKRKLALAHEALKVAPTDPQLAELYDEWWNRASDELGRLLGRLYEIESDAGCREFIADGAYGRSL